MWAYDAPGGRRYELFACVRCGLEFWDPRTEDRSFYEAEHSGGYDRFHSGVLVERPAHDEFLARPSPSGPARLLDIGCGNGSFIRRAQQRGYEVWGIDFDRRSVDAARNAFGLDNVFVLSVDGLREKFSDTQFDVITCFEVLEHLPDPVGFLRNVAGLLKRDGTFAGSVPNAEREFASFDRHVEAHDMPPHHFTWWSPRSLGRLLETSGFGPERMAGVGALTLPEYVRHIRTYVLLAPLLRALRSRTGQASGGPAEPPQPTRRSVPVRVGRAACLTAAVPLALGTYRSHNRSGKTLYFEASLQRPSS